MIAQALQNLKPGAQWVLRGDEYSGLEWLDTEQSCPSEAEVSAEVARIKAYAPMKACKEKAKQLIALTDWSQYPDVQLDNKQEFVDYRSVVRDYIINPVAEPDWPIVPEPIWS